MRVLPLVCAIGVILPALLFPQSHSIPRASGTIKVDGMLDEAAWGDALIIDRFYEVDPGDNTDPPVRTVGYLTYDRDHFYLAFKCFDPRPEQIRARYADRDSVEADDYVGIMLDPFNDKRNGLVFLINPLGVQMDRTRQEPDEEDEAWDAIWSSAGRITAEGYEVEAAIPFKSLRFPNRPVQEWGFLMLRIYPRHFRYQLTSVPIDRDKNCFFCQVPALTGMEGIKPGHNIELVPTLTGIRTDEREDPGLPLQSSGADAEAGLSGTWGVTPNLTLNATVNPDFSQVEADTQQIAVNTRFALFYEEKRPFFLEGGDYFTTPLQAVYTRTVADPSWGLKFTGKEGADGFGVFFARDRQANFIIPSNQDSEMFTWDHPVDDAAVRYRRDVGEDSTLGLIATSRSGGDYFSRLYGGDERVRVGSNDFVNFQWLQSRTQYPEDPWVAEAFDGSRLTGEAFVISYEHESRNWEWSALWRERGPDFRADLGYIPRVDARNGNVYLAYILRDDKNPWYSRIMPGVWFDWTKDYTGKSTDWEGGFDLTLKLARQTDGEILWSRSMERYNGTDYHKEGLRLWFNSRFSRIMTAYIEAYDGDEVDYANDRLGHGRSLHLQYDVRLGRRLFVWVEGGLQRLDIPQGRVFDARLYYLRTLYHFSNTLFVRAIVQAVDIRRDPELYMEEVNRKERTISSQYLLTYKINPFTLFYLGYSDMGLEEDRVDLTAMNRTWFVKLSYAFRP
jgi:hypothetical protein